MPGAAPCGTAPGSHAQYPRLQLAIFSGFSADEYSHRPAGGVRRPCAGDGVVDLGAEKGTKSEALPVQIKPRLFA